jgi:hypothetical protein
VMAIMLVPHFKRLLCCWWIWQTKF